MNFERFEKHFSSLVNLFRSEGFYKEPSTFEVDLYGKFLDYNVWVKIIVSRLESEIKEFSSLNKSFLERFRKGREPSLALTEELITTLSKIQLDLSDFYIHTRIFLDTLNMCIKYSLKNAGNKKWNVMTNSIKGLLNERKIQTYKKEIDSRFFGGLENKVSWIRDLKDSRDKLLHQYHHFVLTDTRQGELGYDLIGKIGRIWGTETVKPVLKELQSFIDKMAELMGYLHKNLPRT